MHKIVAWAHAYRQARIGPWERCARDGERFRQRIRDTSVCLEWVFRAEHRNRIFFQRFRPLVLRAAREEREAKAKEDKRLKEELKLTQQDDSLNDEIVKQEKLKKEQDAIEEKRVHAVFQAMIKANAAEQQRLMKDVETVGCDWSYF